MRTQKKLGSAVICALAAAAVCADTHRALAIGPELIVSTLASHPSAQVPGTTDSWLQTDFGQLCKSPSGNRWIVQCAANLNGLGGEVVLTGAGTTASLAYRSDIEVPWLPAGSGFFPVLVSVTDQYAINDAGDIAFGADEAGNEVVALRNSSGWSVKAREGATIPFDPAGRVWPGSGFDVAGVSVDGTQVSFRAASANTVPATTAVTYLVVNDAPVVATGTTIPTGQLTSPDRAYDLAGDSTYFRTSAGGTPWAAVASLSGATANDDIAVVSNAVVAQESFPFSTTSVNRRLGGADISGNGAHWFMRGQDSGGTVNWAAKDGVVMATTGAPITSTPGQTELWANQTGFGRTFFQITDNDAGNYIIVGGTNAAAPGNAVIVYNGSTVLFRQGAPIDVDNNGLYDDNVFGSMADTGSELYTTFLSNDGYVYTTVQIVDSAQVDLGEAVIRIRVPSACVADFNGVGGVTVQDIFDFLAAWFQGLPSADVNGAAGVTVQDIFDFLSAWFAGCP